MRKHWKGILFIVVAFGALVLAEALSPKPINWTPTYSNTHKIPFGTYALFDLLDNLFPKNEIISTREPIYNTLDKFSEEGKGNYILINGNCQMLPTDEEALLKFVHSGNNAFLSSEFFYGAIADTLNLESRIHFDIQDDTIGLNFTNPDLKKSEDFRYRPGSIDVYFSSFDTVNSSVLGINSKGKTNFIRTRFGKGYFYLSTVPKAFTNYHLLYKNSHEYIEKALSYLPQEDVIWDEYYKLGRLEVQTPLRFFLKAPPLKWSVFLTIAFILLFMLFEAKRKQRVIPVITPLKNTTLEFAEIVGRLYFQQGNHKNLAEKKIVYFLDYIRTHYQLKTNKFDKAFLEKLSERSGIKMNQLTSLFSQIQIITKKPKISQHELHVLSNSIESFYQKCFK